MCSCSGCRLRPRCWSYPGNHDIEWWRSPLGLIGERQEIRQVPPVLRRATPVLEVPGCGDRGGAQQLRGSVRVTHLEPAGHGGEGASARGRRPTGCRKSSRAAPAEGGARARHSSQHASGRPSPAAWGWPAGARRSGDSWPPAQTWCSAATIIRRAPGRSRAVSRSAPPAPTAPLPGRPAVGVQPGRDRRRGGAHAALPLGIGRTGGFFRRTGSASRRRTLPEPVVSTAGGV